MELHGHIDHRFVVELRDRPGLNGAPLASHDVTSDVPELIDEAVTSAILSEELPPDAAEVVAQIHPVYGESPLVERIDLTLSWGDRVSQRAVTRPFTSGGWDRWWQGKLVQLREEGTVQVDQVVHPILLAMPIDRPEPLTLPPFEPPTIRSSTLEECGVRQLAEGELTPDRPLLINARFEEETIRQCEQYGQIETGGAVLGRCVRLPAALPSTKTSIVTIFSTLLFDARHVGDETQFHFHPGALAEAQHLCDLRGMGESIITVFHTHGWGCGDCNQKVLCPVAEARPSLQDYQLLATLFPGKSTLMPIAGRKKGATERRPVLQVYAWRSGQMRPIRWRRYED